MTPRKAWVGVTDNEMDVELYPNSGGDDYCRIYTTKKEASKHYECVCQVMIVAIDDPETKP